MFEGKMPVMKSVWSLQHCYSKRNRERDREKAPVEDEKFAAKIAVLLWSQHCCALSNVAEEDVSMIFYLKWFMYEMLVWLILYGKTDVAAKSAEVLGRGIAEDLGKL